MADNWYYVQKGNRQGPVTLEVISSMITKQELKPEDFVWKKGFDNWKKIKEVAELQPAPEKEELPLEEVAPLAHAFPAAPEMHLEDTEFSFTSITDPEERLIFIRVGHDRGGASSDYGPFSLKQLQQLFRENRINAKTFVFTTDMKEWKMLADVPDYQQVFNEQPPVLKDAERRVSTRKPFVARLFVENNKKLFEGLCRDISIGGMQILVSEFKGKAGDQITVNVHPENTDYHFNASGSVVRILEGNAGFTFRFQGLSPEAAKAIEKYIQEN